MTRPLPRRRYDHRLARLEPADVQEGEIGGQTIEAEDAKRCRDRRARAADLALDRLGIHHGVLLPAERASHVLARVKVGVSRRFDPPDGSERMTAPSATGSE